MRATESCGDREDGLDPRGDLAMLQVFRDDAQGDGLGRPESGMGKESLDERCSISEGGDPLGTAQRSALD